MPNTRLRNDDDVARLRDEAEVEVVMRGVSAKKGGGVASSRAPAFNGQPIIYWSGLDRFVLRKLVSHALRRKIDSWLRTTEQYTVFTHLSTRVRVMVTA